MTAQSTDKARARELKREEAAQLKERLAGLKERTNAREKAAREKAALEKANAPANPEPSDLFVQVGSAADGSPLYTRRAGSVAAGSANLANTNTLALLALVFGLLGGVAAIPLGHIARSQIKRTGESGAGTALAGLVLGYLCVAAVVGYFIYVAVILAQYRAG